MKFGFYSCMGGVPWGGSEELWFRAAMKLIQQGHDVTVNYKWWPNMPPRLQRLEERGARLWLRMQPPPFWRTKFDAFRNLAFGINGTHPRYADVPGEWVSETRPDCVLVTLGYHPDRVEVADDCIRHNIPYAINVQAASSSTFIHGRRCEDFRRWYSNAEKVFFVSGENRDKVETNLAIRLDNAEIVDNPFNVDFDVEVPWPEAEDPPMFRLACVGRIHFQSKGQDLLVDVLKRPKWRERNLCVSIYGKNQGQEFQLQELIRLHGLEDRIRVVGFAEDVSEIWRTHHGLILPSRYEGAALVFIEAMLCRRVCVATDTGRNRELTRGGDVAFLADSPTAEGLDAALERAWQARERWQELGEAAGELVRQNYSADPVGDYAERLVGLVR